MKSKDKIENRLPEIGATLIFSSRNINVLNEITAVSEVLPTKIRLPEDYKIKEFSGYDWQREVKIHDAETISEPLNQLIKLFEKNVENLTKLMQSYNLNAYIVIVIHANEDELPEIVIDPQVISFANTIKAEISIDLYSYAND